MHWKAMVRKFPYWIKQGLKYIYSLVPFSFSYGKVFRDTYNLLCESEKWDEKDIEKYQIGQLTELFRYAYKNVPYYRDLFKKINFNPERFHSLDDLKRIPTLTKEMVKENYEKLISVSAKSGDYVHGRTGGSTSEPMKFLIDASFDSREYAFLKYVYEKFGYKLGTKCIKLKGDKVARPESNIFWSYDPVFKYLLMDSDYLNDTGVIPHYLKKICEFGSHYIFGFPSSVYLFAKQLELHPNMQLPEIKLIMLVSENTYDWQLDYIKKIFRCNNVFYFYGHSEKAAFAVKCKNSDSLHFLPQYGFTEIIKPNGDSAQKGEIGEIVATSFNRCFPLIRYRTKDYAMLSEDKCDCLWRKNLTVSRIDGRLQEYIVTKDNRLVSICTMGAAHFKELSEVMSTQYYQDIPGELQFRVLPMPGMILSDGIILNIKTALEDKLEHKVRVSVKVVNSIDKTIANKHKMIDQRIDVEKFI